MSKCRFISCNKRTTLVGDSDNGGGYACVGMEVYGKSLYLPVNFVALKKKKNLYFKVLFPPNTFMVLFISLKISFLIFISSYLT